MDRETSQAWGRFLDDGLRRLRAGARAQGPGFRVAQFITMPSFTPNESLEIFQTQVRPEDSEYHVARTTWRIDLDAEKFSGPPDLRIRLRPLPAPEPTMEIVSRVLDRALVEELRARLAGIVVPLRQLPPAIGCDGTSYELRLGWDLPEIALKWWCDPPEGWEPAAEAFEYAVTRLQEELAKP